MCGVNRVTTSEPQGKSGGNLPKWIRRGGGNVRRGLKMVDDIGGSCRCTAGEDVNDLPEESVEEDILECSIS